MEDERIIRLYNARSEEAISDAEKYGHDCHSIAMNILSNEEDAEESVNDTWGRCLAEHSAPEAP